MAKAPVGANPPSSEHHFFAGPIVIHAVGPQFRYPAVKRGPLRPPSTRRPDALANPRGRERSEDGPAVPKNQISGASILDEAPGRIVDAVGGSAGPGRLTSPHKCPDDVWVS